MWRDAAPFAIIVVGLLALVVYVLLQPEGVAPDAGLLDPPSFGALTRLAPA